MESANGRGSAGREGGQLGPSPGGVGQRARGACGLCGEPLIAGATGDQLVRGVFHLGCLRKERREALSMPWPGQSEYRMDRRRRRRS